MSALPARTAKPKPEPLLPIADSPSVFGSSSDGANEAPGKSAAAAPASSATKGSLSGSPSGPGTQHAMPPSANAAPPQPVNWKPNDPTRGWEPLQHGRLRCSLNRHYKDDDDQQRFSSPFSNALPEDLTPAAAEEQAHADAQTPTNDALLNTCDGAEPRMELTLQMSVINAISSAYTSSGYPSVMTSGNARGAVYGSFVDLKSPSTHTLNLPPKETLIVAPSGTHGEDTKMETLMKVLWHRGTKLFVPAPDSKPGDSSKRDGGDAGGSSPGKSISINPTAAAAVGLQRPTTLQQHIQQFPDGIHGKHSSPHLHSLLLRGEYPTTMDEASAFPPVAPANTASTATAAASPNTAAANVPPPGVPPEGPAPVQHTLVSANTFNHLSIYFVAHQDGRFLYSSPVQSLSASIATRKVTAHHLFMIGREEVNPIEDIDGYELQFASAGSSSVASPSTPGGLGSSGRRPSYQPSASGSAAATGADAGKPDCVDGRRTKLSFRTLSVPEEARSVFFDSNGTRFAGADAQRSTVQAALVGFQVEPLLMIGNQNGDIFVYSILQERVVQRLNYNAGLSVVNSTVSGAASSGSGGGKFIVSPISCIVEVQNGLEKKLCSLVQNATLAKQNGRSSFVVEERVKYPTDSNGAVNKACGYFPLSPSLFAVGFDCGEVLLLCITSEGGWMLKHFSNGCFGYRPIQSIAPRIPSFSVRLWACYAAAPNTGSPTNSPFVAATATPGSGGGKANAARRADPRADRGRAPTNTLITSATTLFVPDEEQHVAAISCSGGCIVLVRLPGLEVLSSISVYDYNAVGEILELAWTAASATTLITPDILIASGEDDTVTAFQLVSTAVIPHAASSAAFGGPSFGATLDAQTNNSTLSTNSSFHISSGLRILERKRFHRSWVNQMSVLPLVLSAAQAGHGMPQFLGTCLLMTSYDNRTSFWPILFNSGGNDTDTADGGSGEAGKYLLIEGPTAAYPLHNELVVGTAVGGGGTSYFVASVCCRGRVRLWSCAVRTD